MTNKDLSGNKNGKWWKRIKANLLEDKNAKCEIEQQFLPSTSHSSDIHESQVLVEQEPLPANTPIIGYNPGQQVRETRPIAHPSTNLGVTPAMGTPSTTEVDGLACNDCTFGTNKRSGKKHKKIHLTGEEGRAAVANSDRNTGNLTCESKNVLCDCIECLNDPHGKIQNLASISREAWTT